MSQSSMDRAFMRRALFLAERGRGRTSPNPAVGAVIVSGDGVVVGAGYHTHAGGPHAEIYALREAGDRAKGATLYCTLEPCCHEGRTGPCVVPVVAAGLRRAVVAMQDPNPRVNGGGIAYLKAHGVDVVVSVEKEAAEALNAPFIKAMVHHRPLVIAKIATSLDGRIAEAPGRRTRLTSAIANREVQRLRAEVDAIAVGSTTMLTDDPLLTVRDVYRERPLMRVVFDSRLRTPVNARVFSTLQQGPVVIVTRADADSRAAHRAQLERAGATLVTTSERSLVQALQWLHTQRVRSLLLEGGSRILSAAWSERLIDRLQVWVAPVSIGCEGVPWEMPADFSLNALKDLRAEQFGPDVRIEGHVHWAH